LGMVRLIFSSMRMHIVRVEICSIDESSIYWFSIASSIIFEGRFSEVSGEGTIRDPPGGLLELNKGNCTFYIIFS